jgi:CRISPR-associated protein Cmr3
MIVWYEFKPADTLFFRGAESLDKGSDHRTTVLFPPSPDTIKGAIRTAYLIEKKIDFKLYNNTNYNEKTVIENIGRSSEKTPWEIIGPLVKKGDCLYIPAPCTWFFSKGKIEQENNSIKIHKAKKITNPLIKKEDEKPIFWLKPASDDIELVSLCGRWINVDAVTGNAPARILNPEDIFAYEERTGIGLDVLNRTVLAGHLFTMTHVRLLPSVSIVFGITKGSGLSKTGIMKLGGEQRFGIYKEITLDLDMGNEKGKEFINLSPIPAVNENGENISEYVLATGKIKYIGGWDLRKGFHKPLRGYYPAGTVFSKKISINCLCMEENDG